MYKLKRKFSCGLVVKMLDSDFLLSEFKLQSYYIHFQTATLRKGMNPLILQVMS